MITRRRGTFLPLSGSGAHRERRPEPIVTDFTGMWEEMVAAYMLDGDDDEGLVADSPMVDGDVVEGDVRAAMDAAVARRLAKRKAA